MNIIWPCASLAAITIGFATWKIVDFMDSDNLLVHLLYYLTAAVIAVPVFKRLGLGSILGYLFAGVVLGPHLLGIIDDPEEVLHFAEYGVILLLFIIGLELAPDRLWRMRGQIAVLGGSQLLISAVVLAGLFTLLDLALEQSLILGLTFALSSTAFAMQLMSEERILASPLGRMGFSILLLQDLAVIPILIFVDLAAQTSDAGAGAGSWYLKLPAVVLALAFGRYGLNTVLGLVAQSNNREIMTAASLLIVVSVAVLMEAVGLSMGLGAFIAGIMLANSNYRHQIESDIEPFKGILLGLFFIAVGMTLNISLLLQNPLFIIACALALVAIKVTVIVGILRWRHVPLGESFKLGLILSQGGEFAFVVLAQATRLQLFTTDLTDQLTLVVGISMALTSPLVMWHRKLWKGRSQSQPNRDQHWDSYEPEVIIAGFGRFGQIIGRILAARSIPFTAMDKDPVHVQFVQKIGNRLFFGNPKRLDLLRAAGIKHAKTLVVAVDNPKESLEIIDIAREQNSRIGIVARAIDRSHAYELHQRNVDSVIRDTFASSLEAATDTLKQLGYSEGQALQIGEMFRQHDEAMLLKAVEHKDNMDELLKLSRQGRKELEILFDEDSKSPHPG